MTKKSKDVRLKQLLRLGICVALIALIALVGAVMVSAEVYSGECGEQGDNVIWTVDTETGTLVIAGQGYTEGYSQYVNPSWSPYWDSIKEAKLSSGILNVGHWFFYGCKNLEKVSLPESVTQIEFTAFSGCSSLREVNIPSGVKVIERSTFYGCSSLETIHIPDGVTTIRGSAFANCRNLRSIVIPDSVTEIEIHAFSGCNNLQEITLSENLAAMGDYALSACYGLSEITVPLTLESIGNSAFMACDGLTDIYYDGSMAQWKDISIGTGNECLLEATLHLKTAESKGLVFTSYGNGTCYISGRGTCTDADLIIPSVSPAGERVTRIKNETFANCPWLTSVTIPEGVTSLGEGAFKNCPNLTSVSIPDSMETVSKDVFTGCAKIIEIENGIKYVDTWVIGSLSGITVADIRNGTRGIVESAFARRDSLVRLSIPESVERIGQYAFSGCTALEEIFYDARELVDVFSDYNSVFYNAGKNSPGIEVIIGAHAETVPTRLFCPYNSYSIDPSKYAPNIVSLVFEEGSACKYIQYNAFRGCSNLATVTLPEGLKTLDGAAFGGCNSLTELRIPDSVTYVINGSSVGGTALEVVNGVRYVDTWAVGYERGVKDVVLREGTVGIAAFAFEYYSMDTLVIPASLKYIGDFTFDSILDTIGDVYYMGTRQDWSAITFGSCNATLGTATYHYLGDLFDLSSASLTLGTSLTMNYYAKADPAYGTPAMRFTYRGKTETVPGVPTETEGEYVFSLTGIAPQCMGETIKAELILTLEDGTELVVDAKASYSVREYCDDALAANPDNKALATLLADLLAYGDAAQDYTGFKAYTPVSEGFAAAPSEWEAVTDTDFTLSDKTRDDIRFTSAGVRFGYVNRLYFKIKAVDLTGVTLTVNGKTYTAEDLTLVEDTTDTYILYTDPIYATEFDKVFNAELCADGEVIQTLTYSVRSYVYAKQNSENTEMAALVRALYTYGRSAVAYKNEQ